MSKEHDYSFGIAVELKLPEGSLTKDQRAGLIEHATKEAQKAAKDYLENEVDPDGCWCVGLSHRNDCKNWVMPY